MALKPDQAQPSPILSPADLPVSFCPLFLPHNPYQYPSTSTIDNHASIRHDFSFPACCVNMILHVESGRGLPNQLCPHGLRAYTLFHIACKPAGCQHAQSGSLLITKMKACRVSGEANSNWSCSSISVRRIWTDRICPDLA